MVQFDRKVTHLINEMVKSFSNAINLEYNQVNMKLILFPVSKVLFVSMLYISVNNFSDMSGRFQYKAEEPAQEHPPSVSSVT